MNRHWLGFVLSVLRRIRFSSIAIPFAGQPYLDWYLKFWNKQVLNNDVCQWSWWTSRALVENQHEVLSDEDTAQVLKDAYVPRRQFQNPALGRMMGEVDSWWFDNVWLNIREISNEHRRALAIHHALGVGDYVHSFTPETAYLKRPLSEVFETLVKTQRKVFNNAQDNRCSNLDAGEFIRRVGADLMYARFPRPQGLAALRSGVVGWRETWVRGNVECWDELIGQRRGRIGDSVVSKERYLDLIGNFLEGAKHIPKWAIAHAEDGFVTAAEMGEVIRQFRPVEVAYNKDFSEVVGGLNTYLILA
ncbi:MAG TPA: hypothetical protein VFD58_07105 [Blastocatellia bacterium]|nr:hypothetical protein [Blastocatellia bacterium]